MMMLSQEDDWAMHYAPGRREDYTRIMLQCNLFGKQNCRYLDGRVNLLPHIRAV